VDREEIRDIKVVLVDYLYLDLEKGIVVWKSNKAVFDRP
jgi:hypothetical protein